jgi:hypothetical protein
MTRRTSWLLQALGAGLIVFVGLALYAPYVMAYFGMARVERGEAPSLNHPDANGRNKMLPSRLVDEGYGPYTNYLYTRPNPDVIYSACSFDLSEGAVEVGMRNFPEYGNIQFNTTNADTFAVINNRGITSDYIRVLIVPEGQGNSKVYSDFDGKVIESPAERGLAISRILTEKRSDMPRYLALQKDQYCRPYKVRAAS